MGGFESQEKDFRGDAVCDWEPVKLLENSGDVMGRSYSGDKLIATIQERVNQRVDKDGGDGGVREGQRQLILYRYTYADFTDVWKGKVPSRKTPRFSAETYSWVSSAEQ